MISICYEKLAAFEVFNKYREHCWHMSNVLYVLFTVEEGVLFAFNPCMEKNLGRKGNFLYVTETKNEVSFFHDARVSSLC